MTPRATLLALIKTGGDVLTDLEFRNLCQMLYGMTHDKESLRDCLLRDAATDGAFLLQVERDAMLHIVNGGSIDDQLQREQIACK